MLSETYRFPGEAWLTAVHKLGLDGVHIELLAGGDLIQVSVPVLKTQLRSISSSRKERLYFVKEEVKFLLGDFLECNASVCGGEPTLG